MSASGVSKLDNGPRIRKSVKDDAATPELSDSPQENQVSSSEISEAAQKAASAELTPLALRTAELFLAPLIFTALGFAVRMYKIGANDGVVWDEAHFGKFGSYYLRHEFYHDVHPPLGKMLVGLSGYLAGYNGSWDFPSGEVYPDYIDYTKMRIFQAVFSALCVPIAYFTGKEIGLGIPATWLFTLMVCLELLYVTLARFILLDSMLLFFTVASFFAMARFNTINLDKKKHFGRKWWKWLLLTGVALGCTCSVKMVGLFVTTLVGLYTVVDLWNLLADKSISWTRYSMHWLSRFVALVMIPLLIFLISFKIHFDLLYKSGTGDAAMPSLFQANLEGSSMQSSPRDVAIFHSRVTLKNQGLTGGLLHSHIQAFPEGSKQQQVTTYSHKDSNNEWIFERARGQPSYKFGNDNNTDLEFISDGSLLRIMHPNTGRNLHTHEVPAPVTNSQLEVACYGNMTVGDFKDNWKVEIMDQHSNENKSIVHPLTTFFRLYNPVMDCYLGVSGAILPEWGFRQGEVVCHKDPFKKDKRMWWGIEENTNELLPEPEDGFKLPKTTFLRDFVHLNLAMMNMNNALVIDHDKQDNLASVWWEWPTLWSGIRMCGWNPERVKYFMIGSPATTWTSSVGVILFGFIVLFYLVRWQRQYVDFPRDNSIKLKSFLMSGIYPMIGWGLHYMPFVIMSRVTYTHHYVPALYFAMIVFCYEVQTLTVQWGKPHASIVKKVAFFVVYLSLYALVGGVFWYLRHISFGMEGDAEQYKHLNLLPSWEVS